MMPTNPLLAQHLLLMHQSQLSLSQPPLHPPRLPHRALNLLPLTLTNRNPLLSLRDMIMGTTMVLETLTALRPQARRLLSPSLTEQESRKTGKFTIDIHTHLNL